MAIADELQKRKTWNATSIKPDTSVFGKNAATFSQGYNPTPEPTIPKEWGIVDIVKNMGKPYNYEAEIRQAERQKKLGVLTDILGMAGNLGTAIAGRRLYGAQPNTAVQADARLQQFKDLARNGAINYQNDLKNAAILQYQQNAKDDANRAAMAYQRWKDTTDFGIKAAEAQARQADRDTKNKQWQAEQQRRLAEFDWKQRNANANRAIEIAKLNKELGKEKDKNTVYWYGEDGKEYEIPKSKMNGIAAYMYQRMKDYVSNNPEANKSLEDLMMQFGEGGDITSKNINIVMRRLQEFPELAQELDYLLMGVRPNTRETQQNMDYPTMVPFPKADYGKYEGLSRPKYDTGKREQATLEAW